MINLLLTLGVALACGFIAYKLGVPGGALVGAIIGAAALNIFFGTALMPSAARTAAQIVAGAFIGCSAEKSDVEKLPRLIKPLLLLISAMLLLNLGLGFLIWKCSPVSLLTALLCAVPGGMSDMPIIASDMGADASKVAVMQFLRLIFGIGILPSFIMKYSYRRDPGCSPDVNNRYNTDDMDAEKAGISNFSDSIRACVSTLSLAAVCGLAGKASGLPAGTLLFSMVSVLVYKLFGRETCMPVWIKRAAQVLSGAYIGCGMSKEAIFELQYLIVPAFIIIAGYFLNCIITGKLLHRLFGMTYKEGMLTASPAGATDMALIMTDMGIQGSDVAQLQIFRMITVVSVFPQIISLVVSLVGG